MSRIGSGVATRAAFVFAGDEIHETPYSDASTNMSAAIKLTVRARMRIPIDAATGRSPPTTNIPTPISASPTTILNVFAAAFGVSEIVGFFGTGALATYDD